MCSLAEAIVEHSLSIVERGGERDDGIRLGRKSSNVFSESHVAEALKREAEEESSEVKGCEGEVSALVPVTSSVKCSACIGQVTLVADLNLLSPFSA